MRGRNGNHAEEMGLQEMGVIGTDDRDEDSMSRHVTFAQIEMSGLAQKERMINQRRTGVEDRGFGERGDCGVHHRENETLRKERGFYARSRVLREDIAMRHQAVQEPDHR